jgi:DNA-binding MarR family transcriptional regulator
MARHLSTLLRRLHLHMRKEVLADLETAGYDDLSAAHIYVFQLPGPEGARPTELAERTNMTKQAMNHLLATLERAGYLTRAPVAGDRRGSAIQLTARGRALQAAILDSAQRVEREWTKACGRDDMRDLKRLLTRLDEVVTPT